MVDDDVGDDSSIQFGVSGTRASKVVTTTKGDGTTTYTTVTEQ
jgi:hypothetical protein